MSNSQIKSMGNLEGKSVWATQSVGKFHYGVRNSARNSMSNSKGKPVSKSRGKLMRNSDGKSLNNSARNSVSNSGNLAHPNLILLSFIIIFCAIMLVKGRRVICFLFRISLKQHCAKCLYSVYDS